MRALIWQICRTFRKQLHTPYDVVDSEESVDEDPADIDPFSAKWQPESKSIYIALFCFSDGVGGRGRKSEGFSELFFYQLRTPSDAPDSEESVNEDPADIDPFSAKWQPDSIITYIFVFSFLLFFRMAHWMA